MNVGIGTSMRQFDYAYAHRLIDCIACRQTLAGDKISEWQGSVSGLITGIDGCCARAASGHTAAPARSVMKLRRFMSSMGDFLPYSLSTPQTGPFAPASSFKH